MKILNGWKEIAACLHRTPKSAMRWERLGLPVQRISESRRSPVIAFSDQIECWLQNRGTRRSEIGSLPANIADFVVTQRETRALLEELRAATIEHRRLLIAIRESNRRAEVDQKADSTF